MEIRVANKIMLKLAQCILLLALGVFPCLAYANTITSNSYSAKKSHSYSETNKSLFQNKDEILQELYRKLKLASNTAKAQSIEKVIENVWLESGSPTVDLLMSRALAAQRNNKNELSLEILNQIVKIAPTYTEGWNRRAMIYFYNQNYALALLDIRRVLALDVHNFHAINGLGLIMQEIGNKKGALKVFKRLIEIHPYYTDAKKTLQKLQIEVEGQDT